MGWTAEGKDGVTVEIPDGVAVDDPRVGQMLSQRRAAVSTQRAADTKEFDPTAGMGMGEKTLASIGGGLTNVGHGVQQMLGLKTAPTSQDVTERRARDEALHKSTDLGIAPDWVPSIGKSAEFVGESLPFAAMPGAGTVAGVAGKAGAPLLAKSLGWAAGTPARQAMLAGAAQGALQPLTEEESRGARATGGALVGGAVARALPAAMGAIRKVRPSTRAQDELLKGIEGEAGGNARYVDDIEQRLATAPAAGTVESRIPQSATTRAQSPAMARTEVDVSGGRAVSGQWDQFYGGINKAESDEARRALAAGGDVGAGKTARKTATDPLREDALRQANEGNAAMVATQEVRNAARDIARGDYGGTVAVKRIVQRVENALDEIAPDSPNAAERLYALRKELGDLLKAPAVGGDELSAAAKMAQPQVLELRKAIDKGLGEASSFGTGGKNVWSEYLTEYQKLSRPVETAEASVDMAAKVFPTGGKMMAGDVPQMQRGPLAQALAVEQRSRFNPSQPAAAPETLEGLQGVLRSVQREEAPFRSAGIAGKRMGDTQRQEIDRMERDLAKGWLRAPIRAASEFINQGRDKELTRMLQNPEAALTAIQMARRAGRPLSPVQEQLLKYMGATSAHGATKQENPQ